jgi:hypothetical protein
MTQRQKQRKLARRQAHLASVAPARVISAPSHQTATVSESNRQPLWVKLFGKLINAR